MLIDVQAWSRAPVDVIISSSSCTIYLLLLITSVTCSHLYRRAGTIIAVGYWLVAVTSLITSSCHVTSMADSAPMAYYVIMTSYFMIPVRRRLCCVILGAITGLTYLVVFTIIAALRPSNHLVLQVG